MKLTRLQYDYLVSRYPVWMNTYWNVLQHSWGISGVYVRGDNELVRKLKRLVG